METERGDSMKNYNTYRQIERIFLEINLMQKRCISITELKRLCEVDERTIKRDIAFIRERLGIDVINEYRKGYKINGCYNLPRPVGM